jgi:methyl-accepting chemotaxis protein
MKIRLSIRQKILISAIGTTVLCYILSIGFIATLSHRNAYRDAIALADQSAREAGLEMENILEKNLLTVRTLASAYSVYAEYDQEMWDKMVVDMYVPVFEKSPGMYKIWDSWELNVIDSTWDRPTGRIMNTLERRNGRIRKEQRVTSLDGDNAIYKRFKENRIENIEEPYRDVHVDSGKEALIMTSFMIPIMANGTYTGLVGADITLNDLQNIVKGIKPFEGSFGFLLSNKGTVAGHSVKDYLTKSVKDLYPNEYEKEALLDRIARGETFSFEEKLPDGSYNYVTLSPIVIGETVTPWSVGVSVPSKVINGQADKILFYSIFEGIGLILLLVVLLLLLSNAIAKPLKKFTVSIGNLAQGKIGDDLKINLNSGDELEDMAYELSDCIDGLNAKAEFARDIERGDFSTSLKLQSDEDKLGLSLVAMQESLKKAKDLEEKRNKDDEVSVWTNEGLNHFAETLRQSHDNINELSYLLIKSLVKYLEVNQGGIFLFNDKEEDEQLLELVSAFAYDRRKYHKRHYQPGEGLVGACALEKERIYLEEIPDEYIEIVSGLGGSNPSALLLVPIKHENNVLGVIELASFNKFTDYMIDFCEKVAKDIGMTLRNLKINQSTNALLEQSRQQSEALSSQEEEMRQNLEELQATQEEAARQNAEQNSLFNALSATHFVVEYDMNGIVRSVNDKLLRTFGITEDTVLGTHHKMSYQFTDDQERDYEQLWADMRRGKVRIMQHKLEFNNVVMNLSEVYTPIKDVKGDIIKVIKFGQDISELVK